VVTSFKMSLRNLTTRSFERVEKEASDHKGQWVEDLQVGWGPRT
jgi:hypothetical protein